MRGTAVVVGAGVAGLAVARGLHAAGWVVEARERGPGLPTSGTALGMWPEAMEALDRLDAGEQVRAMSVEARGALLLRPDGSQIARLGDNRSARLIARPALHTALADGLPADLIRWGSPVETLTDLPEADVVVAADGVHSTLREALWGVRPRDLASITFRGTVPVFVDSATETWGPSRLFGITPQHGEVANWFACLRADALHDGALRRATPETDRPGLLRQLYGNWHPGVLEVLDSLDGTDVDRRRLVEVPPLASYVNGNVVLVGDSAHAMAPNLGRGACESLLDAVCLVQALTHGADVGSALERYDAERRTATTRTVRLARILNRVSTAGRLVPVRDSAVSAAARLASWRPGATLRPAGQDS